MVRMWVVVTVTIICTCSTSIILKSNLYIIITFYFILIYTIYIVIWYGKNSKISKLKKKKFHWY